VHQVQFLPPAEKDLAGLDSSVGKRIVKRISWLAENLAELRPEPLAGDLAGLYKLRVGDFRVLYEIVGKEELIVIHYIGHRRQIYKRK
jgi:mRNA interferase RelE/StbE